MSDKGPVVVSGTAVASPYDHSTVQSGAADSSRPEKERGCRDPIFAVLLYANVAAIAGVVGAYGTDTIEDAIEGIAGEGFEGYAYAALATGAFAIILSGVALSIMMCIPETLIKISLAFAVIMSGIFMVLSFLSGSVVGGVIGAMVFALMICYAFAVRSRIPFATANLVTALTGVRSNCGLFPMAYISVLVAFGWSLLWTVAFVAILDRTTPCSEQNQDGTSCAIYGSPNYGYLFLLFVSYFYTHQVIQNVVHCTTAGVVGTWWLVPEEAQSCCSPAVRDSWCRSMTTSFGSICFGSLVVAVIQALRQLANAARNNDDANAILICIVDCILSCLESLAEYINKWAFVYVGIYGQKYLQAGKSVMELFVNRGWEAIIADDLVGMTLSFVSIGVGLVTGAVGVGIAVAAPQWFSGDVNDTVKIAVFVLGLIIGLVLASIMLSIVGSAVNATIVLFAESPAEFQQNHPELSQKMRDSWISAFPGCL